MDPLATWEKVLVGIFAVLLLLWFAPGVKRAMEQSRQAESKDWRGVLLPLALVILFIMLLIASL